MTRILAGIVALVSIAASLWLSVYQYTESVGLHILLAIALSVSFIGFVNLIFEVGWGLFIKAHQGKITALSRLRKDLIPEAMKIVRTRIVGGVLCIIASLCLESVNIVNMMGAQVHSIQKTETLAVSESSTDLTSNLDELKADKKDLESKKDNEVAAWKKKKSEYDTILRGLYPKIADRVASPEYAEYRQKETLYEATISKLDKDIEGKQKEIESARSKTLSAKTTESAEEGVFVGTVYEFIAQIFGSEASTVQFWMVTLPSLFLGIVSCVSLSLVIYTRPAPKKEKESKDA